MRFFYLLVLVSSVFLTLINKPEDNFWNEAPTDDVLLYNIYFTQYSCYAVTGNHIYFKSYNNGSTWQTANSHEISKLNIKDIIWSARICCSSLKTTNGGKSWVPCSSESQDRFCRVFLKDPNTGFQPAGEFLKMVCSKIFTSLLNNESDQLKNPRQYTEYYSSKNEGWAPGWYLSDLITFNTEIGLK
jgi:hypothetical protein